MSIKYLFWSGLTILRTNCNQHTDDFYLYQSPGTDLRRPVAVVENGLVRTLSVPTTTFWSWKGKGARDLVLMLATEPEMAWSRYVNAVLDFLGGLGAERIYTIGGTYDSVPHTAEPLVSAVASEPGLTEFDMQLTTYSGPASIHTMLLTAAASRGLKSISIWGHAPYYVQVANAKVSHAVLTRLTRMLGIALDLEDVCKAGEYLEQQVTRAVEQKPELAAYVKQLEEQYRKGLLMAGNPPGMDVIKEVEDFLRDEG